MLLYGRKEEREMWRKNSKNVTLAIIILASLFLFSPAWATGDNGDQTTTLKQASNSKDNCLGTSIIASKIANGFLEKRLDYDWDLQKTVTPASAEIKPGESEAVTFTLTISRNKTETDLALVKGKIRVENSGEMPTENLKIEDVVQYRVGSGPYQDLPGPAQVIIPPEQLGPGEFRFYDYQTTFTPVPGAEYRNVARVTITNYKAHLGEEYGPSPQWSFSLPVTPTVTKELDATAHVIDVLNCPEGFNCQLNDQLTWDLTGSATKTYTAIIQNVSAPCGNTYTLMNTATLTEQDTGTERAGSVTAQVYTGQCPPPPPSPCERSVQAYVYAADSNLPVEGATVTITGPGSYSATKSTGSDGKTDLFNGNLATGLYTATAVKDGYASGSATVDLKQDDCGLFEIKIGLLRQTPPPPPPPPSDGGNGGLPPEGDNGGNGVTSPPESREGAPQEPVAKPPQQEPPLAQPPPVAPPEKALPAEHPELPYTGGSVLLFACAGTVLVALGILLRRRLARD